jgi:hypothetical protein
VPSNLLAAFAPGMATIAAAAHMAAKMGKRDGCFAMRNPFFAIGPAQLKAIEPNPSQRTHVARFLQSS